MKWTKHLTNSRRSYLVRDLRRKLGPKAVLAWYELIETIAEVYEGQGDDFSVTLNRADWLKELSIPKNCPQTFTKLLTLLLRHGEVTFRVKGKTIEVKLTKIMGIADEYTNKVRRNAKKTPDQIKREQNKTEEIKREREAPPLPDSEKLICQEEPTETLTETEAAEKAKRDLVSKGLMKGKYLRPFPSDSQKGGDQE